MAQDILARAGRSLAARHVYDFTNNDAQEFNLGIIRFRIECFGAKTCSTPLSPQHQARGIPCPLMNLTQRSQRQQATGLARADVELF